MFFCKRIEYLFLMYEGGKLPMGIARQQQCERPKKRNICPRERESEKQQTGAGDDGSVMIYQIRQYRRSSPPDTTGQGVTWTVPNKGNNNMPKRSSKGGRAFWFRERTRRRGRRARARLRPDRGWSKRRWHLKWLILRTPTGKLQRPWRRWRW